MWQSSYMAGWIAVVEPLEPRLLLSGAAVPASSHQRLATFQHVVYDVRAHAPASSSSTMPMGSSSPVGLTPAQIRTAYGINSIVGDGTGQTIALIDAYDDPAFVSSTDPSFATSDLHKFDVQFGLPDPPSFTKLDQNGGTSYPAANSGWSTEIALDVEWAHAIAPGASIVLVEANSAYTSDLISVAVDTARRLSGVSVISMSFGLSEYSGETSLDQYFTTPAGHGNVTFLASTGDAGSPGNYPAYSPNVVAVGGTTLTLGSGNAYGSETGWSSSGGGQSTAELQPSYQNSVQQSGWRQTPDVAFDASPTSGVAVYDSYGSSGWVQVGGTSLSSPCWAGLIAIANQLRANQGLSALDGPSQTLPALYSLPAADFHDITSGSNGGYSAGPGYDMVTGRGSPVANLIVPGLAAVNGTRFYWANMNTNPGWTFQGQWAWGVPTGQPAPRGGPDPTSGYTGANVVGYNLSGPYAGNLSSTMWATTPAINCSGHTGVALDFWQWLGVGSSSSAHAYLQVSNDGTNWTTIFQNSSSINDAAWTHQVYDISAVADNKPTVYIRWGMGPTSSTRTYCGWNIDDVALSSAGGLTGGPRVTDAAISIASTGSGTGGAYRIGDTVTARWDNTASGDFNTGALATTNPVTVDFTQFGGPAAVAATNNAGIWIASYTIVPGSIDAVNRNVAVTVTDIAGNAATVTDTSNLRVDAQAPVAAIAAVVPNPRTAPVTQIAIVFNKAITGLGLSDLQLTRSGGGNMLTAAQTLTTSDSITWYLGNLAGVTGAPGAYSLRLPAAGSGIVDAGGNPMTADAATQWLVNSFVVGRQIFYNNSVWDGNNAAANAADDAAIATDKQALLPGGTASFANYTSFSGGTSGVMVDIAGIANPGGLSAADFVFTVGNSNDPTTWATAPAPINNIAAGIRLGAGAGGSDRVTLVWADGAIANTWLQVTVLASANTGLASNDVFYFGNAIGEVGNSVKTAFVDGTDIASIRDHFRTALGPIDPYDINRDGVVDAADMALAVSHATNFITALKLIATPALPAAIAPAVAATMAPTVTAPADAVVAQPATTQPTQPTVAVVAVAVSIAPPTDSPTPPPSTPVEVAVPPSPVDVPPTVQPLATILPPGIPATVPTPAASTACPLSPVTPAVPSPRPAAHFAEVDLLALPQWRHRPERSFSRLARGSSPRFAVYCPQPDAWEAVLRLSAEKMKNHA